MNNETKSETQRTDVAEWHAKTPGDPLGADVVYASVARQLETELNAAKAENERLTKELAGETVVNLLHGECKTLRAKLAEAEKDRERLLSVIREDVISARIIESEVRLAGINRHGITRDIGFIISRCTAAIDAAKGGEK